VLGCAHELFLDAENYKLERILNLGWDLRALGYGILYDRFLPEKSSLEKQIASLGGHNKCPGHRLN
jgi:hypothetical protein